MSEGRGGAQREGSPRERMEEILHRLRRLEHDRAELHREIRRLAPWAGTSEASAVEEPPTPEERSAGDCATAADDLLECLPGIFYLFGTDGRFLAWNRNLEVLTGYRAPEVRRMHPLDLIAEEDRPAASAEIRETFVQGSGYLEARLRAKDGSLRTMFFAGARIVVDGRPCIAGVGLDISERKVEEERLRSISLTDELTGLLNRRGFFAVGSARLAAARDAGAGVVVLYADLDRLKVINDTMGHAAGDRALVAVARALRRTFRESDVVARLGGDEFAALATDPDGSLDEAALRERFRQNLPAETGPAGARALGASVGLSRCSPCDDVSMDDLLAAADERMYAEKHGGTASPRARPHPLVARSGGEDRG